MPVLQLLIYDYVPDMTERRAPHRAAHLEHIATAQAAGRLIIAGGLGDPPRRGLLAFAPGVPQAEIERFAEGDPYRSAGLIEGWQIEPWNVVTAL